MDNVTHSLAAVLIAEAVCTFRTPSSQPARFRTAALCASLLANNFPDFDFVYRGITPGRLGYLLHHRGHTHTVLGALVLALATVGLVYGVARARGVHFDARDLRTLGALAVGGTFLHIGFDLQNNYGVHPFWPFDDRWYYGDFLYIVEPLLWTVAVPVLVFTSRTGIAKVGLVLLLGGGLAFGALFRAIPLSESLGLLFVALVVAIAARALSPRGRVLFGLGGWAAVTLAFFAASHMVESRVASSSARLFPKTRVVDVVRTPSPGNPLCWSVITVGVDGPRYVARRGLVSLAPGVITPHDCGAHDARTGSAPLTGIEETDGDVLWRSEFSGPVAELAALRASDCNVAAFLRWSRVPFWARGESRVGDLRFERSRGVAFAEVPAESGECPPHVPPWLPPRSDVFGN